MAAPAARKRAHGGEDASTRERMLEAALHAFSERGYDGASTRAIAAQAGVNQGLIPYYFGTKEALWREAVDRAFAEMRGALDSALDETEDEAGPERLADLIRNLVRFVARRPEFARLMSEEGKRNGPRMRWIVDRHVRPLYEATQELTRRAGTSVRLPADVDSLHIHYIVVGAVTQIFHAAPECRRLTGRDPTAEAEVEAHADALVALFVGTPTRRTRS